LADVFLDFEKQITKLHTKLIAKLIFAYDILDFGKKIMENKV